jgi:broad specificity phosphatase PhoE
MTRLVLVRHGETVWHEQNRYAGVSDVELTARGVEQAARLAGWARTAGLASIWTSNLTRAQRTAAACVESTGLRAHIDSRLRELDFGAAEGLTMDEIRERFPQAAADFQRDPVGHHLPDGEDPVRGARRFAECLRDVCDAHPDGRALVVAHSTVMRLALCALIGVPLPVYRRLFPSLANCAVTEIRLRGDEVAILTVNAPIDRRPA